MYLLSKKSTIEWCENNYEYSNYISELFNTLTGACLAFCALFFYLNHKFDKDVLLFNNILIVLTILGVGTMLFHATLLYVFQMMDEIPMLFLCFEYMRIIHNNLLGIPNHGFILNIQKKIYIFSFFIICIGYYSNFFQVFLFQMSILSLVLYLLILINTINIRHKKYHHKILIKKNILEQQYLNYFNINNELRLLDYNLEYINKLDKKLKLYKSYFYLSIVSSLLFWSIDNFYCDLLKELNISINGHALWHIITSIGLYYSNMIILVYLKKTRQYVYLLK